MNRVCTPAWDSQRRTEWATNSGPCELGGRLKLLDDVENRLLDEDVLLQETLSTEFDADLTEVITRVASTQAALTATLQIASTSLQLNLLSFL
jgi:flagellin-like hook-associated protein FlgL